MKETKGNLIGTGAIVGGILGLLVILCINLKLKKKAQIEVLIFSFQI